MVPEAAGSWGSLLDGLADGKVKIMYPSFPSTALLPKALEASANQAGDVGAPEPVSFLYKQSQSALAVTRWSIRGRMYLQ